MAVVALGYGAMAAISVTGGGLLSERKDSAEVNRKFSWAWTVARMSIGSVQGSQGRLNDLSAQLGLR
jgi:hypothetical protein